MNHEERDSDAPSSHAENQSEALKKPARPAKGGKGGKEARLAAALRENLRRRKAASRDPKEND